jgi:hypothetical protein
MVPLARGRARYVNEERLNGQEGGEFQCWRVIFDGENSCYQTTSENSSTDHERGGGPHDAIATGHVTDRMESAMDGGGRSAWGENHDPSKTTRGG